MENDLLTNSRRNHKDKRKTAVASDFEIGVALNGFRWLDSNNFKDVFKIGPPICDNTDDKLAREMNDVSLVAKFKVSPYCDNNSSVTIECFANV